MSKQVRRGQIWVVDWSPSRGSEQTGKRPAVVIQTDAARGGGAPGVGESSASKGAKPLKPGNSIRTIRAIRGVFSPAP